MSGVACRHWKASKAASSEHTLRPMPPFFDVGMTMKNDQQLPFDDEPVRPYTQDGEPSAGWSGTDTSRAGEKLRGERQKQVFAYLLTCGTWGATSREVEYGLNLDHGKISGPLSVMHRKAGRLRLLKEKRAGFRVYVTAGSVDGRDYE